MSGQSSGTVRFVFTDIVSSTLLLREHDTERLDSRDDDFRVLRVGALPDARP